MRSAITSTLLLSTSALSVTRRGCRSPRRRMATGSTGTLATPAIRMGLFPRTPMVSHRAIRCGVRRCRRSSVRWHDNKFLYEGYCTKGVPAKTRTPFVLLQGKSLSQKSIREPSFANYGYFCRRDFQAHQPVAGIKEQGNFQVRGYDLE